jgi:pantothenate kinase
MDPVITELAPFATRLASALRAAPAGGDEKPVAAVPREDELRDVLFPLLDWCLGHRPEAARGLVGIAGPGGSGKTLLLSWLAAAARELGWRQFAFAALDAYHLPSALLDSRCGVDPDGNSVPLRLLKGTPPTFDAAAFLAALEALKDSRREMRLPAYSRQSHEPRADVIRVGPEVEWVFVEGNFLFLDAPPWRQVRLLFDRKIYIDAGDETLRRRLASRHAAAGRDPQWIEAHFRRADGPNLNLIRAHADFADVFFRWGEDGHLRPWTRSA